MLAMNRIILHGEVIGSILNEWSIVTFSNIFGVSYPIVLTLSHIFYKILSVNGQRVNFILDGQFVHLLKCTCPGLGYSILRIPRLLPYALQKSYFKREYGSIFVPR